MLFGENIRIFVDLKTFGEIYQSSSCDREYNSDDYFKRKKKEMIFFFFIEIWKNVM